MADYKKLAEMLRVCAETDEEACETCKYNGFDDGDCVGMYGLMLRSAAAIEELLRIGAKMHTWIFLHTTDEQAAYDEIGLTEEQNALFGYSGQMILEAAPPLDEDSEGKDEPKDNDQPPEEDAAGFDMVGF